MSAEQLLLINPRRRKRHAHKAHRRHRRRVKNPFHRSHRRHRHRNPFSVRGVTHAVIPAGIGALGAVGLDVVYGYLSSYLPASISSNVYLNAAAKVAGAFGLGWLGGKALGAEKGKLITAGALTVIAYGFARNLLHSAAPTLPGLAGLAAYQQMGAYMPPAGMGAYNPAPYLQGMGDPSFPGQSMGPGLPLAGTSDFGPGIGDSMF
jgi:hypothetical protein